MAEQEIIMSAYQKATEHGAEYGAGGTAAAAFYRSIPASPENMLYMIAVLANRVASAENRTGIAEKGSL